MAEARVMVRWLLVGGLLVGMGTGLRRGWLEVRWQKLADDLHLPALADPSLPLRTLADPAGPPPQGAASSSARQAR